MEHSCFITATEQLTDFSEDTLYVLHVLSAPVGSNEARTQLQQAVADGALLQSLIVASSEVADALADELDYVEPICKGRRELRDWVRVQIKMVLENDE